MSLNPEGHLGNIKTASSACFDVAPPKGVASRSRDLMFYWEMKNIKNDTFI